MLFLDITVAGPEGAPIAPCSKDVPDVQKKEEKQILFQIIYIAPNILIKLTFHSGEIEELEKLIV